MYPGTTIVNLHAEYQNSTEAVGFRVVCQARFREVFHQENYSIFIPRKDQCDICVSAKHGNIDDSIFQAHLNSKDQARAEKSADKEAAQERKSVRTMDLQGVLLCPRTKASALYYKTKLQLHNFTLFDMKTKNCHCYMWEEVQGYLSSEVFVFLQYFHFERFLKDNPAVKELIIWSDGCGYQNRNTAVTNAYIELSRKRSEM